MPLIGPWLLLPLLVWQAEQPAPPLLTTAESSAYAQTSRHAEVLRFCQELAKRSPAVHLTSMGQSRQGRDLPVLVLANPAVRTAAEAKASGKPVVMAFANIHAGEVEGKEALQMLARDLVLPRTDPLLDRVILLLNPILNADGNEKIDPKNRTWQGGPAGGVGQRTNAEGLDLNRDFVKLKSPEVRSLVALWNEWDPLLVVDCHSTNGSYHRHLITYDGPRHPAADPGLRQYAQSLLPELGTRLKKLGGWESFFYGYFTPDRASWESYPPTPRYGIQLLALRNRLGILSEAYTYAPFRDRVLATRDFVRANLDHVAERAKEVTNLCHAADRRAEEGKEPVALRFKTVPCPGRYNVLGFVEEKVQGRSRPTAVPKEYPVVYLGGCEPTLKVSRPPAYWVPADQVEAVGTLRRHGIQMEKLDADRTATVEWYLVDKVTRAGNAYQGVRTVAVAGRWEKATVTLQAGTYRVSTRQPKGTLATFLLEPEADDGLLTWDLFGAAVAEGKPCPIYRESPANP